MMKKTANYAAMILVLSAAPVAVATLGFGCDKADKRPPAAAAGPPELKVAYDDGYVEWTTQLQAPNSVYSIKGKMEVTFGDRYVTVRTEKGVTVFLHQYLIHAGPRDERTTPG